MRATLTRIVIPAMVIMLAAPIAAVAPAQAAPVAGSFVAAADPTMLEAQQRFSMAGIEPGPHDGLWGPKTRAAVIHFQTKFKLPVTGQLDAATLERLRLVTANGNGVHAKCLAPGKVICVDKTQAVLRAFENGQQVALLEARFGAKGTRTREGTFRVFRKGAHGDKDVTYLEASNYRNHVGVSMPFPLCFSGGQCVHYSPTFARVGYVGGSLGCVNTRDWAGVSALWQWAPLGTRVYVYRSINMKIKK